MNWFGKSSKVVESKDDMERLGIRLETIKFNHDRNEYELLIHLPGQFFLSFLLFGFFRLKYIYIET